MWFTVRPAPRPGTLEALANSTIYVRADRTLQESGRVWLSQTASSFRILRFTARDFRPLALREVLPR